MASTVTILADHRGVARPKVVGDEYVVDAAIDITSYPTGGETINASDLGLSLLTAVFITGEEKGMGAVGYVPSISVSTTGAYASSSTFKILLTDLDGTNAQAGNTDDAGVLRVRAYGLI
tara:strand:+ start:408 stop:764 length:357 start_codon:yes stop_codon:yes gene_type:complete